MKPAPSEPPDPQLSQLLRSWSVDATPPPGFTHGVWRRIRDRRARAIPNLWIAWLDRLREHLREPRLAWVYVVAFLALGASAGTLHGRASAEAYAAGLQDRYVQSIDPFAPHVR